MELEYNEVCEARDALLAQGITKQPFPLTMHLGRVQQSKPPHLTSLLGLLTPLHQLHTSHYPSYALQ